MSCYTIHCAGFDLPQRKAISAILDLAESALTDEWRIIDNADTHTVMINLDADNGQQLYTEQQNCKPYQIILVSENEQALSNEHWFLLKKPNAPPSLRSITLLFNQISIRLAEAAANIITADTGPDTETSPAIALEQKQTLNADEEVGTTNNEEPDFENSRTEGEVIDVEFVPDESFSNTEAELATPDPANNAKNIKLHARNFLFGIVLQAAKDKSCRIVQLNRYPPIYLAPEDNVYYFAGSNEEMLSYCTTAQRIIKSKSISKTKLSNLIDAELKTSARSLTVLSIYALIQASQGRLLEGHNAERPVRLTAMPDVKEIPLLGLYNDIAAFMSNRESDLFDVSEALQIPLAKVFEFYNACFILGYIDLPTIETESEAVGAKSVEVQNKKSLKRFFSAFFQNKGG